MPPKISVEGVSKSFAADGGTLRVLDDLTFSVGDGELVAIVGPSGCGKSTLMNILAGFERPDCGAVRVDGALHAKPDPRGILISQRGSIFPWLRVRENLMFGLNGHASADKSALADRYAAMVGLKGFERSYPDQHEGQSPEKRNEPFSIRTCSTFFLEPLIRTRQTQGMKDP